MRTSLDIDDDVLQAAKKLAVKQKCTASEVVSGLARKGLLSPGLHTGTPETEIRNGVPVFAARPNEVVALDHVERLMDEEGL